MSDTMEIAWLNDEIDRLRAERDEARRERDALRERVAVLEESTHYANGCADLAMKHRDIAETAAAQLEDALIWASEFMILPEGERRAPSKECVAGLAKVSAALAASNRDLCD